MVSVARDDLEHETSEHRVADGCAVNFKRARSAVPVPVDPSTTATLDKQVLDLDGGHGERREEWVVAELVGGEVDPVAAVIGDGQVGELDVFQPIVAVVGLKVDA